MIILVDVSAQDAKICTRSATAAQRGV